MKSNDENDMQNTDKLKSFKTGKDPEQDAWLTAFFIENHLDYYVYPDHAASPEQIRFMVFTDENERYYPCSDPTFNAIMARQKSPFLQNKYNEVLQNILSLINNQIEDPMEKKFLESLIKIKFRHETRDEIMIPSRLEKRLMKIFLNRTRIIDPFLDKKEILNRRASGVLKSDAFKKAINYLPPSEMSDLPPTLTDIKEKLKYLEFKRLLTLSAEDSLWKSEIAKNYTQKDYMNIFNRSLSGDGVNPLLQFLGISFKQPAKNNYRPKMILWLTDEAGEILVDFAIIRYLASLGHKIILAFKERPLFTKVDIDDVYEDNILYKETEKIMWLTEKNLSKNELVKILRSDNKIFAVSDGTQEIINLLLVSTTFCRIFKETDAVISRGEDQKRRFFNTRFQFTRDIFNISSDKHGTAWISFKPKHFMVIKFSHEDLERKAKKIIDQMKNAKDKGMTVIFYSAIIGSIPGRIQTAKKILSVFIENLKRKFAMTFIINPSEYFEPGMDADDLMYMWEFVQRSGFIDIWRFQAYEDIVDAFQLMNQKVPPEWVGKDATFSTGCTKEMKIAVEVQKQNPEMQIIGPSMEKFMRRNEYGVGKMYDKKLG